MEGSPLAPFITENRFESLHLTLKRHMYTRTKADLFTKKNKTFLIVIVWGERKEPFKPILITWKTCELS